MSHDPTRYMDRTREFYAAQGFSKAYVGFVGFDADGHRGRDRAPGLAP